MRHGYCPHLEKFNAFITNFIYSRQLITCDLLWVGCPVSTFIGWNLTIGKDSERSTLWWLQIYGIPYCKTWELCFSPWTLSKSQKLCILPNGSGSNQQWHVSCSEPLSWPRYAPQQDSLNYAKKEPEEIWGFYLWLQRQMQGKVLPFPLGLICECNRQCVVEPVYWI